MHAPLPRRVPRGVRTSRDELLGLRHYGGAMRRILGLDANPREARSSLTARSQGMEYTESRPYSPGDDVRRIDWRVTARTGRTHTKLFRLERCNELYCVVDQRPRMRFGTRSAFKSVAAAEIAALAGWAAAAGSDRFGALVASGRLASIRTGAAEPAATALCTALAATDAEGNEGETPLDGLAARAAAEASAGARFIVVSDFADGEATLERAAKLLRSRGTLMLIWVFDPIEERLPLPGRYPLTDGREHVVLDTAMPAVRDAHSRDFAQRRARLQRCAMLPGTRCHVVRTGAELFAALERSFTGT
ncbi:MAG TPA: DUF58 domain-containing protein, partial [Burkholderiales bacterium]|jgi:uncharacterized protein (DUF58 family)|nr:DUF58 domain-containing protein [Burkholderiales bacterium]